MVRAMGMPELPMAATAVTAAMGATAATAVMVATAATAAMALAGKEQRKTAQGRFFLDRAKA